MWFCSKLPLKSYLRFQFWIASFLLSDLPNPYHCPNLSTDSSFFFFNSSIDFESLKSEVCVWWESDFCFQHRMSHWFWVHVRSDFLKCVVFSLIFLKYMFWWTGCWIWISYISRFQGFWFRLDVIKLMEDLKLLLFCVVWYGYLELIGKVGLPGVWSLIWWRHSRLVCVYAIICSDLDAMEGWFVEDWHWIFRT